MKYPAFLKLKNSFALVACLLSFTVCYSQNKTKTLPKEYYVKAKNYYLLTLFERDKAIANALANDAKLSALLQNRLKDIKNAAAACKDVSCYVNAIKFSAEDIKAASERLAILYKNNPAFARMITTELIPSGAYSLYNNLSPSQLFIKAWEQDATAVNYTIDVYAGGKKPNYPIIDSISYNVTSKSYNNLIYDAVVTLYGDVKDTHLFFEPPLRAALLSLQINERENAGDFEPMAQTVNKAAVKYIKAVDWKKSPYTNILVPGAGPGDLLTILSGEGMLRCRMAAQQFNKGVAPLIIVSGGKAHPYKTKYCEAVEMKKYLTEVLHLPGKAIIVEPHARHTTTNLRNCARLIYKYGIPANKPGMIVTDKSQTDFIMTMNNRCMKELGYVPYRLGNRLSDTEVEYRPLSEARQIDPDEPLDPR